MSASTMHLPPLQHPPPPAPSSSAAAYYSSQQHYPPHQQQQTHSYHPHGYHLQQQQPDHLQQPPHRQQQHQQQQQLQHININHNYQLPSLSAIAPAAVPPTPTANTTNSGFGAGPPMTPATYPEASQPYDLQRWHQDYAAWYHRYSQFPKSSPPSSSALIYGSGPAGDASLGPPVPPPPPPPPSLLLLNHAGPPSTQPLHPAAQQATTKRPRDVDFASAVADYASKPQVVKRSRKSSTGGNGHVRKKSKKHVWATAPSSASASSSSSSDEADSHDIPTWKKYMSTGRERKPKSGGSPTSSAMHRILAKHHKRRYSAKSDANKAGKSRHRRGRDYSSPVSLMLPDSSSMSDIDSLSSTSSSCSDSESETDVPRSVTIRQNMPENSAVKKRIAKSGTSEQRTGARTSIVTASPLTKGIQGRFPHPITIPSSAVSQNSPVSEAANPMSFPPTPTTTPPDGHLLSLRKTGYWTGDETHRLINAVTAHGQAWGRVARDVQTRDSNQCEKRWRRIDPNDFTPKKDEENVRRADYGWVDWDKTRATSVTSPSSVQSNIRLPSPYRGPVEPIPRDPRSRIIFGDQSSSGTGDEEHDDDDDEDESDDDGGQNRKTSIRLPSAALVAPVISGIPPSTDDAAQYYYSLSVAPTTSRPRLAPKPPTPRVLPAPVIAPSPPTAVANTIGAFSATSPAVSATSTKAGVPPSEIHIAPSVTISVRGRTPHSQPSQRTIRPWTPSEDACLLHAVSIHSNNWRLVASMVPTRNTRQCKEHYLRVLARRSDVAGNAVPRGGVAKMGRGDESHPPTSRTSATSPSMAQPRSRTPPAKSAKMSAPSSGSTKPKTRTRRPPWTPAEDTRLQQAYDEMGPRWAVMVAEGLVGHRTEEECRGRMRVLKARATGGGSGAAKTSKRAAAGTGEMDEEHPSADQSAPESAQEDDDDDVDDDDDDDDDTGAASEV